MTTTLSTFSAGNPGIKLTAGADEDQLFYKLTNYNQSVGTETGLLIKNQVEMFYSQIM